MPEADSRDEPLSGRTSTSVKLTRRVLVGSTHLLGKRFPIHLRTLTPLPDLFPGHLDRVGCFRDACSLPVLQRSVRSPSCAAKPGAFLTPPRPRHPGRGSRARRAPPLARSHWFPVPAPVRTQPATRSAGTRGTRGVAISFRRWRGRHDRKQPSLKHYKVQVPHT